MSVTALHHGTSTPERPAGTARAQPVMELVLSGDIDMQNAEELQQYLTESIERGRDVVVNLTDVRMIDCICLGVLVRAALAAGALHCALSLVSPSPLVRMTMRCTGTDGLLTICDDREAALCRRESA